MSEEKKDVRGVILKGIDRGRDQNKRNREHNSSNPWQGEHKKVLCICSAGLLRSPTAAVVLAGDPFNFNTRAAGMVPSFALVVVEDILLTWADEIVCMTPDQKIALEQITDTPVVCLNIPDSFQYRDPKLMEMIKEKYEAQQGGNDGPQTA